MAVYSPGVGWLGVLIAVTFWGAWAVFLKAKALLRVKQDPLVTQTYVTIAVCIVGLFISLFVGFRWTWWSVLGAVIWLPATVIIIFALRVVGLGAVYGICSGFVILSSFLWGVTAAPLWGDPPCKLVNPGLAIVGLFILIASVAGLAAFGSPDPNPGSEDGIAATSIASEVSSEAINTESIIVTPTGGTDSTISSASVANSAVVTQAQNGQLEPEAGSQVSAAVQHKSRRTEYIGMAAVALGGSIGGMMMIPMKLAANDGYVGFEYVPSFGISCLILNLILLYSVGAIQHTPIRWDVKVSIPPTFASGLFWSIGNIGGILASLSPLGQTTGFPLTQGAVLIGGLLAIVVFKEVTVRFRVACFMASSVLLMIGAFFLAKWGQCMQ